MHRFAEIRAVVIEKDVFTFLAELQTFKVKLDDALSASGRKATSMPCTIL
jgi:hypothetical protein